MTIKFKKVYIDSRYCEGTASNFKYELPETFYCEPNTVFYVDDITIPVSFYAVEEGVNNKLYLYIFETGYPDTRNHSYIVSLAPGNYVALDFVNEVQTKINQATSALNSNIFICTYTAKQNTITIALNSSYHFYSYNILTPLDLKNKLNNKFSLSYNTQKPDSCNDIISNNEGINNIKDLNNPYVGLINLQSIRNIFLHSPNLGHSSNVGPQYENTIIKKIPISANYNEVIYDQVVLFNDCNDVSGSTLKTLEFSFRDAHGNLINFHGCSVSFSLIFSKANPDN